MKKLISHLSTLIWGIGAITALVLNALGILPESALLPVLFLIVCLFIFYMVAQNWQMGSRLDTLESILKQNRERLDSFFPEPKQLRPRIRIEDNPKNKQLWSGFKNEFSFFNAPFTLAYEELLPDFAGIFRDTGIRKVRILMFSGVTEEQTKQFNRRMERLTVFVARLKEVLPESLIREKLQVRISSGQYVPANVFFLGIRDGFSVAVLYIWPLIHGDTPQAAFELHDEKIVNQLNAEFNRMWEQAEILESDPVPAGNTRKKKESNR
ncbi:MAG: hypothetical protein L6Q77_03640 [Bacteroidetes bacterium]|nr:hypothetical protein [Bacteroidota bacterium]